MKTTFDQSWKNWIKTNMNNGQDKDGIFKILLDEGYEYNAICQEMNYEPSVSVDQLINPLTTNNHTETKSTIDQKTFDQSWKNWIKTNVNNGQDKDGIFKILLDEGYEYNAICQEMNYEPSVSVDQLINPLTTANYTQNKSSVDNATSEKRSIKIDANKLFLPNAKRIENSQLELYILENFLNSDECNKIIELIKSSLRPSTICSEQEDKSIRTSRTCELDKLQNPFLKDVDNRICRIMGFDPSYSEGMQGQYYEVGQEFKAHTDYFETHEIEQHCSIMGQRTYTFMIYLNEVTKGGTTKFIDIGSKILSQSSISKIANISLSIKPKTGMAVIWNNLNPDGSVNAHSMHQALPIIEGYKAVITKWFRSSSFLEKPPVMLTKERNEYIPNYTKTGLHKTTLSSSLFEKLYGFYHNNRTYSKEEYVPGDFIFNQNNANKSSVLIDLTPELRQEIHKTLKPEMEKWCGRKLAPTFVYGIREYRDKAVLKLHRDKFETHIISAIINVAQEVNEDWSLVIEDNYYRTHHIFLKPGEVIFYEGGRLKHGRPIPFNGSRFANIFCHFKPKDYRVVVM